MDAPAGSRTAALGPAGFVVTAATVAANLLAYLVPVLAARRLAPADLGALSTAMALVAIATMPGIGLQTAVAVAVARSGAAFAVARSGAAFASRSGAATSVARSGAAFARRGGAARPAWITSLGCGGVLLLATPLLAGLLRLPLALPPLLAALTVPAVLAGWPLGVLQGQERFARFAGGTVLLAAGRYAGVLVGLAAGAGPTGAVALGALVAWSVPAALWWVMRSSGAAAPSSVSSEVVGSEVVGSEVVRKEVVGDEVAASAPAGAVRGRAVLSAASASLAILVASYADLILARRLLPAGESGAYAVGAVLTRAAIWAPQVVTVLALPRLARGRGAALPVGLALVAAGGTGLFAAATIAGGPAVRAIAGARYAALGGLAPYFVAVGALYAVTVFLLNAQLAAGARWPSAGVWAVVAGLVAVVAVVRPATVPDLLACAVGAAAASVLATGAAVWWRRSRRAEPALISAR